jgi:hypothetical protein
VALCGFTLSLQFAKTDPFFDLLHGDLRFEAVEQKVTGETP